MKRIPNITGLRFFLAICVVLFHVSEFGSKHNIPFYNGLPIFNKGYEAVCVFFSLSGFLIIRQLYLEKCSTNTISLKNFYWRRALRIFPLYFLILSFGLVYYNFILPKIGFTEGFNNNYNIVDGILLGVFFMPNVFSSLYSPGGIIEILWSIGVEEQFYLFIAPSLFFIPRKIHLTFLMFASVLFFVIYFYVDGNLLSRFSMLFFYFTSSGIISILALKNKSFFENRFFGFSTIAMFILFFTTNLFVNYLSFSIYNLVSMLLFSVVIGYLSYNPNKLLNNFYITYLGKISYGIYVYHAIVMQFLGFVYLKFIAKFNFFEPLIVLAYNVLVIGITIIISHLSYQYFEKKFMNLYKNN